jgi:hypothetical protein
MMNHMKKIFISLCCIFSYGCTNLDNQKNMYSTAFFYGRDLPLEALSRYQRIVVEPDNVTDDELAFLQKHGTKVYAYLSIGEVRMDSPWSQQLEKDWVLGINKDWNTQVMDLSNSGWRDFLLDTKADKLWRQGYQGFFLDTMDSYQRVTITASGLSSQQLGIITLISTMKQQFSGVSLLFNRGFEVLDEVANLADGVVAESLFAGWNPTVSRYQEVSVKDREWLLNKLTTVRDKYQLPVTVIDYLPTGQRPLAIIIATKITGLGFSPWVSSMELNSMGVGMPDLVH